MPRPVGSKNRARKNSLAQERAREILEGSEYQDYFERRLQDDSLAPGVETMLWHYAYGKPTDRLEINDQREATLRDLTDEQLAQRAVSISQAILAKKTEMDLSKEESNGQTSIH